MKIKVDEDLPKRVAEALRAVVPDTLTVLEEGLSGILDTALWETVQREERFLITGDKAFANIRQYPLKMRKNLDNQEGKVSGYPGPACA